MSNATDFTSLCVCVRVCVCVCVCRSTMYHVNLQEDSCGESRCLLVYLFIVAKYMYFLLSQMCLFMEKPTSIPLVLTLRALGW